MRKIIVSINGQSKTITLQESILTSMDNPHLLVKKATIFWELVNIIGNNTSFKYDGTDINLTLGYHTFDDLVKEFKNNDRDINLKAIRQNGKCTITTSKKLELKQLGTIVGYNADTVIDSQTKTF